MIDVKINYDAKPRCSPNHSIEAEGPRIFTTDLESLRQLSPERWEALCRYLQPQGKKEGHRWFCGSVRGEPGRSFNVNLRTGVFGDFAADGRQQQGPISYWMACRGTDFLTAVRELSDWLGCPPPLETSQEQRRNETANKQKRIYFPPDLCTPTDNDLHVLSVSRSICVEALRIAVRRGFIFCFDDCLNGRCWLFTDRRRRCGLRRRLSNEAFVLKDGSQHKSACCHGSDMRGPLCTQEARDFPYLAIVEGAPDVLAAIAHAWADDVEHYVAPICMPSTTANFSETSLAYLAGKRSRIFIHCDNNEAGHQAARRWATQLRSAGVIVDGFSFADLLRADSRPVTDLNDLCRVDPDSWEHHRPQIDSLFAFVKL